VKILYFAWMREKVGRSEEILDPPAGTQTVTQLIDWLAARSAGHGAAFANRKLVKVARDQVHVDHAASIAGAREVAFFPPVTGG